MQTLAANTLPAQHWLDQSKLIYSAAQVEAAIDRMVQAITQHPEIDEGLILMCVMRGGLYLSGQLLAKLKRPLQLDYLQANRYQGTQGQEIHWTKSPTLTIEGQTVLVVDDILDEGVTLAEVVSYCRKAGAKHVISAVLTEKDNGLQKPIHADVVGLSVPNQYVFGCGMDVHGWWRNLPEIRALNPS